MGHEFDGDIFLTLGIHQVITVKVMISQRPNCHALPLCRLRMSKTDFTAQSI